jgi:FKBP-type peptidyl-prolyl cis-trans isomerase 2
MAQGPPGTGWIVLVAVLVVAAGALGAYAVHALLFTPKAPVTPLTVQEGDNVTVNYIGIFGTGPDTGRVFDTSLLSVATDNVTYPKAMDFTFRGATGYKPLQAHVGPQSYGPYTSLIPGFWHALLGLQGNQTVTAVIPPSQGYGFPNDSKIQTLPLIQTVPMIHIYTPAAFADTFGTASSQVGSVFPDPHYGWNDVVLSANSTAVVVESAPYVGEVVQPFGWPETVIGVSSTTNATGVITLDNQLTPRDVGVIHGTNWQNGQAFFLSDVNVTAGTYTLDYNSELLGNTLIFTITVVDILPG